MESLHHWFGYTAIAFFVALTPGPAVILALSNSLTYGPTRALICSLGNATGLIVVAIATTVGLGALLVASSSAFLAIKIAGAVYLIFLGCKQLYSKTNLFDNSASGTNIVSGKYLFLKGISVAMTNPKAIIFFIAFLPQFIQPDTSYTVQAGIMIVTFAVCSVIAHVIYVLLAQMLKPVLTAANKRKKINCLFGVAFIALGLSLFTLKGRAMT